MKSQLWVTMLGLAVMCAMGTALACVTVPTARPGATADGRTSSASISDGKVTVNASSPSAGDTSIHVESCWDGGPPPEGGPDEGDTMKGDAPGHPGQKKASAKCGPNGPSKKASGGKCKWVAWYDKDGEITWVDSGTVNQP